MAGASEEPQPRWPDSDYFSATSSSEDDSDSNPEPSCSEPVGSGWPPGWPLPAPRWSPPPPAISFSSAGSLSAFLAALDRLLAAHLARHDYDGLHLLLEFHAAYQRWREAGQTGETFDQWRRRFVVTQEQEHLTCVGLTADLLERLEARRGSVGEHFYMASAEEEVELVEEYVSGCRPPERNENDHCALACQVRVGGRRGVLLLDSGYHVPRAVCVMADRLPPHAGTVAMDCLSGQLHHSYELSPNLKFIICSIHRTTAGGITSTNRSCFFVGGRFDNPYAFAEYRNIFHPLRSRVRRSASGRLLSGLFFSLRRAEEGAASVSLFWHSEGRRHRCRVLLEELARPELRNQLQTEALRATGRQLRMPVESWLRLLQRVQEVLADRTFVDSVVGVNDTILYQLAGEEPPPEWPLPWAPRQLRRPCCRGRARAAAAGGLLGAPCR